MSQINARLHQPLQKDSEWSWEKATVETITGLKKAISSAPVLKFFNSKEPETLSVDASSRGLRAAILQSNHPVAKYASKTLSLS